jgi:aquaporin Z
LIGYFATNSYGEDSPGDYSPQATLIKEIIMTFFFLLILLGATHSKTPKYLARLAIGLGLTLIH